MGVMNFRHFQVLFLMQSNIGLEDAIQVRGASTHAITGESQCHCRCFLSIVVSESELCTEHTRAALRVEENNWGLY